MNKIIFAMGVMGVSLGSALATYGITEKDWVNTTIGATCWVANVINLYIFFGE